MGIPIRLSTRLANRARKAARVQERSLTDQVEHWARLGEIVEATVTHPTIDRLKTLSHDEGLHRRLAAADTAAGRRRVARLIRKATGPLHGVAPGDPTKIVRHEPTAG